MPSLSDLFEGELAQGKQVRLMVKKGILSLECARATIIHVEANKIKCEVKLGSGLGPVLKLAGVAPLGNTNPSYHVVLKREGKNLTCKVDGDGQTASVESETATTLEVSPDMCSQARFIATQGKGRTLVQVRGYAKIDFTVEAIMN